jgi:predicted TIM-barrel fold metal-dependent hydrolase
MTTPAEDWLALTQETAIDPDLPICDPHHHLWSRTDDRFTHKRYLLDELLKDTGTGHRIEKTVYIECGSRYRESGAETLRPVGETEFVETLAEESRRRHQADGTAAIAGIVGHADLTQGEEVRPLFEAHLEASPGRFRGIRQIAAWDTDDALWHRNPVVPGLLLDERFRRGFAWLSRYNLSFEAWLYHHQLPDLIDLAAAFPETTIVLNHVGGPLGIGAYARYRDAIFRYWKHYVGRLAEHPNVVVKLGGLAMPLTGFGWHTQPAPPDSAALAEKMRPYFLWCIETFGTERCMFESNFPVDKESCSYGVVWNAFKRIAQDFSPDEKARLFHDNAVKTYRLG